MSTPCSGPDAKTLRHGGPDRLQIFGATAYSRAAGLLFDLSRCGQAPTPALFDPQAYGSQATPVTDGGRGGAWFVQGAFGEGVLRLYRRGGLPGRLIRRTYLWLGVERTRCVREYRLLRTLHDLGLPVPAPLAAGWWRLGRATYRQALLTARLAHTRPLADWLRHTPHDIPWQRIGATLARFQQHGVRHADLNAHNILLDTEGGVWLIDFDRGRLGPPHPRHGRRMLARLRRSIARFAPDRLTEPGWQTLHAAWQHALASSPPANRP